MNNILSKLKKQDATLPPTVLLAAPEGFGKCLGYGTPVVMSDGGTRAVQNIQTGDWLMGPDSKPRQVLSTTRGTGKLFRVWPNKGDAFICNDAHLLTVVSSQRPGNGMFEIRADKYSALPEVKRRYLLGVRTGIELPEKQLPLDPYFVGLWIGDGTMRSTSVEISKPDAEVHQALCSMAVSSGLSVRERGGSITACPTWRITSYSKGESFRHHPWAQALKECGYGGTEKVIPTKYLTGSAAQRMQLFAGLIDSDGYAAGGCYEISTKSDKLRDAYVYLARSLGFQATSRLKRSTIKSIGFTGYYHRVIVSGNNLHEVPVRVARKKLNPASRFKDRTHFGMTVTPIGDGEYYGFTLSGDGRFLLGDFTITHNTTWGASAPNPLFICAENGLTNFPNIQSLRPASLEELNSDLASLHADACGFKSIVLDTVDWLERMIHAALCKRGGCDNIELYQGGFGKGLSATVTEMSGILKRLDDIRTKHKMWIVLLSHIHIKPFNDPAGPSYDRYEMKGNKQYTGLLREWPDACLFGTYEVFKMKEKGERNERAIAGERIVRTKWSPAWDAKNRLNLPETLPLDWNAFVQAVEENSPATMLKRVNDAYKTAEIPEADKAKWVAAMKQIASVTPDRLKSALEKLTALQPQPKQ